MKFSKEFLNWMSRRMERHIEIEIYKAMQASPFNGAKLPPYVEPTSTRNSMPYPYEREPHRCGPACSLPFSVLMYCT